MNKYIKSPLNYTGGKYKLLDKILPLFPNDINTFVDLFAGGGSVRFVFDTSHHHGSHSAHHHRCDARTRAPRCSVHRHQHDRDDRLGGHHCEKFHSLGRLHQLTSALGR